MHTLSLSLIRLIPWTCCMTQWQDKLRTMMSEQVIVQKVLMCGIWFILTEKNDFLAKVSCPLKTKQ